MKQPKHNAESLAMEEQFGIPSFELDFGEEGRIVVAIDTRPFQRGLAAMSASMERMSRNFRHLAPQRLSVSEAADMTQDEVDGLVERIEEMDGDDR